ncbi:MAG: YIP1 family protein [Clostridia bacterium]|nr:YIP1 family protein [Clostridia bacterium]
MKKVTSIICLVFVLTMLVSLFALPTSAAKPYQTYTYGIGGYALNSPDAYTPLMTVDSNYMGLKTAIDDPKDIVVDDEENIYIADSKGNRIVVLDRYFKLKFTISNFINEYGIEDEFTAPAGVFVTEDTIYVCDTDANRIVTFDREGNYKKIIPQPESTLFDEDAVYKPVAVAVDQYGRIFVVSSTTYEGIIVMTSDGVMTGFIGAQAVTISAWQILWRRFQTDEQRELSQAYISTEFNNIAITDEGFIYVTTSSIEDSKVKSFINKKTKDNGDYSPVKLLNAAGEEIMRRNGFWPPAGEINFSSYDSTSKSGVSRVTDVAVGPEKTWSIIDSKRNKIFTYDFDGNLLFAFGDSGNQLGNLQSIKAVVYKGDTMLVLDGLNDNITVYERTEYGNILIRALENQNNRLYDKAVEDWTEILKRNSNFDAAYIGIGQALYRSGDYQEAITYFQAAYDTSNYSDAYKEVRKEWISKFVILIPIGVFVIIYAWSKFMKYAKKVNKRAATAGGKRTFKEELLYVFHVMFHPFDGFWDIKHEKRGSMRAAVVFILLTVVAFYYQAIGQGYVMNPTGSFTSIFSQAISVLLPFFLFAVANWCLTTLFDGEGSFKDIIIAISYSLVPLILTIIPATIASNFVTKSEADIVNLVVNVGFIWAFLLIFVGMMVTHDYSLFKGVTTTLGTIVGMAFIMFVGILFTTLLGKIVGFISNIILEINYRL